MDMDTKKGIQITVQRKMTHGTTENTMVQPGNRWPQEEMAEWQRTANEILWKSVSNMSYSMWNPEIFIKIYFWNIIFF